MSSRVSAKVSAYFYSHQDHEYYLLNNAEENLMTAYTTLATHWQPHIEVWEGSGSSQAVYCREHDLAKSRFNYWKHKLRPAEEFKSRTQPGSSFVPVRVMEQPNRGFEASPAQWGVDRGYLRR